MLTQTAICPSLGWTRPDLQDVAEAVALTVAYSDVFDYCPSIGEVHRFLIGVATDEAHVRTAIEHGHAAAWIAVAQGFCYLHGRDALLARRAATEAAARQLWRAAHRYARIVSAMPFVRMVAVTGALAMNNVGPDDDVDLFIVTEPGRLWLSRAFIVALARLSQRVRPVLCPNFLVTRRQLEIPDRNLFTAHELFQMIPLSGYRLYRRLLEHNAWAWTFLPNARPRPAPHEWPLARGAQRCIEMILAGHVGDVLERREMDRKIAKLRSRPDATGPTVAFGPDVCRGHFERYDEQTLTAFAERQHALGLVHRSLTIAGGAG